MIPKCQYREQTDEGLVKCTRPGMIGGSRPFPVSVCGTCSLADRAYEVVKPRKIEGLQVLAPAPMGLECSNRGNEVDRVGCGTCANSKAIVHACTIHGKATMHAKAEIEGVKRCRECSDRNVSIKPLPVSPSILFTGGIGDVLALEAMMSDEQRATLETIYYACPSWREIEQLFPALPNYPRLKNHHVLTKGDRTHYSSDTVQKEVGPIDAADWSIANIFPRNLPYNGSSFLAHRVSDPPAIDGAYAVIVDASTWGKMIGRDFDADDWAACIATLEAWGVCGIALSRDPCEIPSHPLLSQLQLPILQAIECLKGAAGYIGIDSWVSILAAKLFPANRLRIKTVSPNYNRWMHHYASPRQDFASVVFRSIPMPGESTVESAVHPHHPVERAELFQAHDGGSIEVEFGELLAALVRAYKPESVLETGTYLGVAARVISQACSRNGFGQVTTLEIDEERARKATAALAKLGNVQVVHADSLAWLRAYDGPPFGLIVLDSEMATRVEELKIIRDYKLAVGPVFVHDTSRLRATGGMADYPNFAAELDALGIPSVECHLSRGWRLFDLR